MVRPTYEPPSLVDVASERRPLLADEENAYPAAGGPASEQQAAAGAQQTTSSVTATTLHTTPHMVAQGRPVHPGYAYPPAAAGAPPPAYPASGQPLPGGPPGGLPAGSVALPDAARFWAAQRRLLVAWLAISIASMVLFFPFYLASGLFIAGEIAMCLGIAGASIHLCGSCRGMDQASQMRLTYSMARAATALDMLTVMLGSLILVGTTTQGLEAVHLYVLFFVVFTVLHTYLSSRIAYAASRMRQLLNPVSSGLVPLA